MGVRKIISIDGQFIFFFLFFSLPEYVEWRFVNLIALIMTKRRFRVGAYPPHGDDVSGSHTSQTTSGISLFVLFRLSRVANKKKKEADNL